MTRREIVLEARAWLGVPYLHQGRSRSGVDCLGLLQMVAANLGIAGYDELDYSRNPSGMRMARLLSEHLQRIEYAEAREGDILHMATAKEPQHLAIISNDDPRRIIHSSAMYGRVLEQTIDPTLKIRGAYRIPGVA